MTGRLAVELTCMPVTTHGVTRRAGVTGVTVGKAGRRPPLLGGIIAMAVALAVL